MKKLKTFLIAFLCAVLGACLLAFAGCAVTTPPDADDGGGTPPVIEDGDNGDSDDDNDEAAKEYVTIYVDVFAQKVEKGKIFSPETPTKPSTKEHDYTFVGWFYEGTDTPYTDIVIEETIRIESRFTETLRKYPLTVTFQPERLNMTGVKSENLFTVSNSKLTVTLQNQAGTNIPVTVTGGKFSVSVLPGNYTVDYTYDGVTYHKDIAVGYNNASISAPISQKVTIGGSITGTVGGQSYTYPSFGSGFTATNDKSVTLTGHTYAYIGGEELTNKYYIEADVKFNGGVGSTAGILAAAQFGNISAETSSTYQKQGTSDVNLPKLAFSLSNDNTLYSYDVGG